METQAHVDTKILNRDPPSPTFAGDEAAIDIPHLTEGQRLALARIAEARMGLYKGSKGYSRYNAAPWTQKKAVDRLVELGLVYEEPTGGREGSAKATDLGRQVDRLLPTAKHK